MYRRRNSLEFCCGTYFQHAPNYSKHLRELFFVIFPSPGFDRMSWGKTSWDWSRGTFHLPIPNSSRATERNTCRVLRKENLSVRDKDGDRWQGYVGMESVRTVQHRVCSGVVLRMLMVTEREMLNVHFLRMFFHRGPETSTVLN